MRPFVEVLGPLFGIPMTLVGLERLLEILIQCPPSMTARGITALCGALLGLAVSIPMGMAWLEGDRKVGGR
jgi:hypothetical protein